MNTEFLNVASDNEIVSTRIFNADAEQVFEAWANPAKLKRWWGPAGFTNTFHEFDFRPGGKCCFVMHGPNGVGNYVNGCIFHTIDRPRIIVWDRTTEPLFRIVATFEETEPGNTKLTFRMQFESKEKCDKIRKFAPDKNEENFDKLELMLAANT